MATLKEQIMRYSPAAFALALLVAVSASTGYSAPPSPLDPRAAALVADPENLAKIKAAWPDYWSQYDRMAKQLSEVEKQSSK